MSVENALAEEIESGQVQIKIEDQKVVVELLSDGATGGPEVLNQEIKRAVRSIKQHWMLLPRLLKFKPM